MATVNKDFKIKNGLIVEGSNATVNGHDILTKKQADQDYIVDLIGGQATRDNTPNTVVKRDGFGNFAAGQIDLDSKATAPDYRIGNAGQLHDNDGDLELTAYDSNTLQLNADMDVNITAGTSIALNASGNIDLNVPIGYTAEVNSDEIVTITATQTVTNKTVSDSLKFQENGYNWSAIHASANDLNIDGSANITLMTNTGDINLNPDGNVFINGSAPSDQVATQGYVDQAQTDAESYTDTHSGLTSGVHGVSGDVVGTTDTQNLSNKSINGSLGLNESMGLPMGSISGGMSGVELSTVGSLDLTASQNVSIEPGSGYTATVNSDEIVTKTATQDISNKRIIDTLKFTDGVTVADEGEILIDGATNDFKVTANTAKLVLKSINDDVEIESVNGDIRIVPNGHAYIGSASAGNQIMTKNDLDTVSAGLNWKQAVNLLATSNVALSATLPLTIDGHAISSTEDGYRILLTGQSTDSENGIYVVQAGPIVYNLNRSADADVNDELVGAAVFVMEGTTYASTSWVQSNHYISGFDNQDWHQFSGSGSVTAGYGIIVDGLEVSVDSAIIANHGYVDDAVDAHSDLTTGVHGVTGDVVGTTDSQTISNKLLSNNSLASNLAAGGHQITNLGTPSNSTDAATKEYVDDHSDSTSGVHGVTGDVVGTTDTQTLTNKTLGQITSIHNPGNFIETTGILNNTVELYAGNNIKLNATGGDIVLNPNGDAYLGSASSGNEIATKSDIDALTTNDIEEGTGGAANLYFTANRAKDAIGNALGGTQTNISVTYDSITKNLSFVAENGVADSTTNDLTEGTGPTANLYFTAERAVDALEAVVPNFTAVEVNSVAKQVAATLEAATAGIQSAYVWSPDEYKSAEFLVKVAYGSHTEISKVLLTLDTSNNIAITEYGVVGTNGSASSISASIVMGPVGDDVVLEVTTSNNNSTITVMGTLLA